MDPLSIILWIALALFLRPCILYAILWFGPHFWLPYEPDGDENEGLLIWCEPIRFLGGRWGQRPACRSMRKRGFKGNFISFSWHSAIEGTLVLPALVNKGRMEREAMKLSEIIHNYRMKHPDAPIRVLGDSSGAFVALRAVELLPEGVNVDYLALLAGTIHCRHDLSTALSRTGKKLIVGSSIGDFPAGGIATSIFGTADRRWGGSMGFLGALDPESGKRFVHDKIEHLWWNPWMIVLGSFGMHDWCMATAWLEHVLAPKLGINSDSNNHGE